MKKVLKKLTKKGFVIECKTDEYVILKKRTTDGEILEAEVTPDGKINGLNLKEFLRIY